MLHGVHVDKRSCTHKHHARHRKLPADPDGRQSCNIVSGLLCTAVVLGCWFGCPRGKKHRTTRNMKTVQLWKLIKSFLTFPDKIVVYREETEGDTRTWRILYRYNMTSVRVHPNSTPQNGFIYCGRLVRCSKLVVARTVLLPMLSAVWTVLRDKKTQKTRTFEKWQGLSH